MLVVGKSGKGQCMSLRVALRQAEPGARILVMPGVYRESLVVDKPVSIIGQGEPGGSGHRKRPRDPASACRRAGVRLGNLHAAGAGRGRRPRPCWCAQGEARVEDCGIVARSGPAVLVTGAGADPVFRDCTFARRRRRAACGSRTMPRPGWRGA